MMRVRSQRGGGGGRRPRCRPTESLGSKSSTGNTILGPGPGVGFAARRAAKSVTSACRAVEGPPSLAAAAGGQTALVLDTPGLGDAARSEEEVYEEIRRGLQELVPHGSQARVGEDEF